MTYDVVVVGAGLSGSAFAREAATRGLKVLLLDRGDPVSSFGEVLSPGGCARLEASFGAGANRALHALAGTAWSFGGPGLDRYDFLNSPRPAAVVDRKRLEPYLREGVAAADVTRLDRARFLGLKRKGAVWIVAVLRAGAEERVACRFVVDSTGRRAAVHRLAGGRQARLDRLVARGVVSRAGVPPWLVVSARPDGWDYRVPNPSGGSFAVRFTEPRMPRRRRRRSPRWFTRDASSRVALRLGPGVVPVGDAAIARDPLCGAGLEHALDSAVAAARLLAERPSHESARTIWSRRLNECWVAYRAERAAVYAREPRWRDHTFWARRSARCAIDGGCV